MAPLNEKNTLELARRLHGYHLVEREKLDVVRRYFKGVQARPAAIPQGSPREVVVMARSSRINIMPIIVNSLVQAMFVDGYRARLESDNAAVWKVWQHNQMDARQTGLNRATFEYGTAYVAVRPGDPVPRIEPKSPRIFTALYADDPKWPMAALEKLGNGLWRLYDESAYYYVRLGDSGGAKRDELISTEEHQFEVTPVVRYVDEEDLDADDEVEPADYSTGETAPPLRGQVTPYMPIQDQIDLTTFDLQIAQHYGAFRQRYIIGWTASSEKEAVKAAASKIWTFKDDPESIKLGEFEQTNLEGYIKSREASLRHGATLSQTPVHELTGDLIQMSAEALAAAEASKDRKRDERQTLQGERHEQTFELVAREMNVDLPGDAQVRWRDTSAYSFAARIDGLGKIAQMLGVPPQELWEQIPGVEQQDIERWKAAAQQGDSFANLTALLERQGAPA